MNQTTVLMSGKAGNYIRPVWVHFNWIHKITLPM